MTGKTLADKYEKTLRRLDKAIATRLRTRFGQARGWRKIWRFCARMFSGILTFGKRGGG